MSESFELLPLTVESLGFAVGKKRLIDNVSFKLHPSGPTCVVGPNGAGKSLLLRLCHGLLTPTSGVIRWAGGEVDEQRRAQAMVFQRPILLRRSVRANMEHALSVRRVPKPERQERTQWALERTGL